MAQPAEPISAVARLRDTSGAVVGAGFLVGDGLVVTCTHVIAAALGSDEKDRPGGPVTVEFPVRGTLGTAEVTATVEGWTPTDDGERGDIAVLRLTGPVPDGVRPARLAPVRSTEVKRIKALGFPPGLGEHGIWAPGLVGDDLANGWLQIDPVPDSREISPGFSGTPAFGPAGEVVGMVVAVLSSDGHTTAFLNPTATLVATHRALHAAEDPPYRGLRPFRERDAQNFRGRESLIDAVLTRAASHSLIVLSGPSGSGKSSLAHAGVLPRLRADGRTVATVRVLPGEPIPTLLARAFVPGEPGGEHDLTRRAQVRALAAEMAEGGPVDWLADRLTGAGGHVVFVDQFEEAEPATAQALVSQLHRLAEQSGPRDDGAPSLLILLTTRGQALDAIATGETAQALQEGLLLVTSLTPEQLREAITPPGAVLEAGLVDRLVTDVGSEPGNLPLLEFTLAQLWRERELGVLTHRAYEQLGGVAGAVARHADQATRRDPVRARRLLLLLARPDDDGVFRRRSVRRADLPAELTPVLDRLVTSRLVVAGLPEGTEEPVVELAHESLITSWPQLGEWLREDRPFRTWLEEIRRAGQQWRENDHEKEALLRGAALGAAEGWAERRGADIGPAEADYLRASVVQDRRRARRGRVLTAALLVLTLLAGVFAVASWQQNGTNRAQLRLAASRALADDSMSRRRTDPDQALQLALAAWHAGQTPEAYGALFTQYAALETVDRVFTGLRPGAQDPVADISTSRDGTVAVIAGEGGLPTVWRGLDGPAPQRVQLALGNRRYIGGEFRISPSGRYLGYANGLGGVFVSDLTHPERPPVDLAPTGPDDTGGTPNPRSIQFAPDDSRLAVVRTDLASTKAELRIWDLRTGKAVTGLPELNGDFVPTAAFFGPVPGSIVLSSISVVASYDLASRRNLRIFRSSDDGWPMVAAGGSLVVSCGRDARLLVRDLATGRRVRSMQVSTCSSFSTDSGSEFAALPNGSFENQATNAALDVADLRTGRVYRLVIPPVQMKSGFEAFRTVGFYTGRDGRPAGLLGDGSVLYRLRTGPAVTLEPEPSLGLDLDRLTNAAPNGEFRVFISRSTGRMSVLARSGEQLAQLDGEKPNNSTIYQGEWRGFTRDSERFLTAGRRELVVHKVPELTVERRLKLPVPDGLGDPPDTDGFSQDWAASVVPVGEQEAIVLYAGVLTRWNVVTGARIGEPVQLREGEAAGSRRRVALLAFASGRRPGHADQVAVVSPDTTVRIWSLEQGRAIATIKVDAALTTDTAVFSPDGRRLAVKEKIGPTSIWQADHPGSRPRRIPTSVSEDIFGFTPVRRDGKSFLLTTGASPGVGIEIWAEDSAKRLALLSVPIESNLQLRGDELTVIDDGLRRTLRLDPDLWFRTLCGLSSRPYTPEEAELLQSRRAPLSLPCG